MVVEMLQAGGFVVAIFGGWILVQLAWRRVFPEAVGLDGDALAGRGGCTGCKKAESCDHGPAMSAATGHGAAPHTPTRSHPGPSSSC